MSHPVTIENDSIRMDVWPQFGGKVSSIIDKADSYDLMFSYPAELPQSPCYDIPYGNGWYAGWDDVAVRYQGVAAESIYARGARPFTK